MQQLLAQRALGQTVALPEDAQEGPVAERDLVLGEPGKAWYMLLGTLNNERIMLSALCTGIIDGVLEDALQYVKQREAFGKTIGSFQSIQHSIAEIAMMQKQAELITFYAADLQAKGLPCGIEANMSKIITSEYANKSADMGIQFLGGMGYAAETDANFCITPAYAACCCRLYAASAARSAVCRDTRMTDAEPGSYEADYCFAFSNVIISLRVTVTHLVVTGGPPPAMCQAA